ncbi:MAG: hypothetical protein HQM11_09260 [SAR324 cluster bacterium]|nr:hypothetical protein [SAR324 cluster bacterium]
MRLRKLRVFVFLFIAAGLIAGCSNYWWYGQADHLLMWRIDDYFDLTREQKDFLEPRIRTHLIWHRQEAIPLNIEFLEQVKQRLEAGIAEEDIGWFMEEWHTQITMIYSRILDDSVQLMVMLNPEQVDYFEKELVKNNEEYLEIMEKTPEERMDYRVEKFFEIMEDWVDSLDREQHNKIESLIRAVPDHYDIWLNQLQKNQQAMVQLLRNHASAEELRNDLTEVFINRRYEPLPEVMAPIKILVLSLPDILNSEQKQQVIHKISNWIEKLKEVHSG